jgi:hypothetical protein
MKKILVLVLFGFLALNANLFSMEQKQEIVKPEKTQLTKMDWAKVVAASVGCAYFGWAALMMYPLRESIKHEFEFINLPSISAGGPLYFLAMLLGQPADDSTLNKSMVLGGIVSGMVACGLGAYVYKKLSVLRRNSDLFSMGKEQKQVKQSSQTQLTKLDWAKVVAASAGCAWFSIAALTNYHAIKDKTDNFLILPMILMYYYLSKDIGKFEPLDKFWSKLSELIGYPRIDVNLGLIRAGSAILAIGLGAYVYKKLSILKSNKVAESKKSLK